MRSSAEQPIVGSIPDVHDLPWAQLMGSTQLTGNALGCVVRSLAHSSGQRTDAARGRPAERVSAFNNYI